jgi:Tfp pilus assembly ATPase PilU
MGMVLLDDHLLDLHRTGQITSEDALRFSQNPKDMMSRLA